MATDWRGQLTWYCRGRHVLLACWGRRWKSLLEGPVLDFCWFAARAACSGPNSCILGGGHVVCGLFACCLEA
jgi:hypothetical protein